MHADFCQVRHGLSDPQLPVMPIRPARLSCRCAPVTSAPRRLILHWIPGFDSLFRALMSLHMSETEPRLKILLIHKTEALLRFTL